MTLSAVNVAPPDAETSLKQPHVKLHDPLGTDNTVCPLGPFDSIEIGLACVPIKVNAVLIVVVVPGGNINTHPAPTLNDENIFAPVKLSIFLLVTALSVNPL
jgi:hypothetical protein